MVKLVQTKLTDRSLYNMKTRGFSTEYLTVCIRLAPWTQLACQQNTDYWHKSTRLIRIVNNRGQSTNLTLQTTTTVYRGARRTGGGEGGGRGMYTAKVKLPVRIVYWTAGVEMRICSTKGSKFQFNIRAKYFGPYSSLLPRCVDAVWFLTFRQATAKSVHHGIIFTVYIFLTQVWCSLLPC